MVLAAPTTAIAFVQTRDRKAAEAFYGGVLGLTMTGDDGFAAVFDLNGSTLRITEIPGHAAGPHPVLGWRVADIAAAVDALAGKGVAMIVYDGMGQDERGVWTSPDGKAKVAFFHDPDRNVLSLTEG